MLELEELERKALDAERAEGVKRLAEQQAAVAAFYNADGDWSAFVKVDGPHIWDSLDEKGNWKGAEFNLETDGDALAKECAVAATVRAAEAIRRGQWLQASSTAVFGIEEGNVDGVDLDDFCFPEAREEMDDAKFRKAVEEMLAKSSLQTATAKTRYMSIMVERREAYATSLKDFRPGQIDAPKLKLNVSPGPPVVQPQRILAPPDEEFMIAITKEYDEMGIWKAPSEEMKKKGLWVSNPVIPKKIDRVTAAVQRRVTVDCAGPNGRIVPPPGCIPTTSQLADLLQGALLMDKDDGFSGYFQVELDEESKHYTGVYTPLGIRVFNVMPLGINVAPAEWNELMAQKFGDLPGMFTLMDDFIRFSKASSETESREELEMRHLDLLDEFLRRVIASKMRLKLPKSAHAVEELEALGMVYTGDSVRKTDWTYKVLREYPAPAGPKQMKRFLALGQWYSTYVDGFAGMVAPLRVFERKERWAKGDMQEGTAEHDLFLRVRDRMAEELRLALPDWSKPFIVKSDWSETAMGGALLQKDAKGRILPIAFVSRKCTPHESKVPAPDGELLTLVWVISRFEKYLLGAKFDAYVDQASLEWMKDKRLSSINNRRLQGAFAFLRQFRFDLYYKKSKEMQDVDALSRIEAVGAATTAESNTWWVTVEDDLVSVPAAPAKKKASRFGVSADDKRTGVAQVEMEGVWSFDTVLKSIDELQASDDEVRLIRAIRDGKDDKLLEVVPRARHEINQYKSRDAQCQQFVEGTDGRLYHLWVQGDDVVRQLFVPLELRGRLVVAKHGSAVSGHRAADETIAKLKKHYFWPSMSKDIREWIAGCGCQRKKGERKQSLGEIQSMKIVRPGEKMIFDFFGPLPESTSGNKYLLVIVDVGSREVSLTALPTKEAIGVAKTIFEKVFFGVGRLASGSQTTQKSSLRR